MEITVTLLLLVVTAVWIVSTIDKWDIHGLTWKIFSAIFSVISLAVLAYVTYRQIFGNYETRDMSMLLGLASAAVLLLLRVFFANNVKAKIFSGCFSVIVFAGLVILFMSNALDPGNITSIRKGDVAFKDSTDVERTLQLNGLPAYEWDGAHYRDAAMHVRFKFKQPMDTASYIKCLHDIAQQYPERCHHEKLYGGDMLDYHITWTDSVKHYANVTFGREAFVIAYDKVDSYYENYLTNLAEDSLKCPIPSNKLEAYSFQYHGPDYAWSASYRFAKPLTSQTINNLNQACAQSANWQFAERGDSIVLIQEMSENVRNTCEIAILKDAHGKYTIARLNFDDY